jgi:cytochrome c-type biogenesis protein CcmE
LVKHDEKYMPPEVAKSLKPKNYTQTNWRFIFCYCKFSSI